MKCRARATTQGFYITKRTSVHTHQPQMVEVSPKKESSENIAKEENSESI